MNNPFFDAPPKKKRNKLILIIEILAVFTFSLLIFWIVILEQNQVNGPSMQPNFFTGQFLLSNRIPKYLGDSLSSTLGLNYQRGDVVVFQKPGKPDFVKRVIALPGEKISIKDGFIYINNRKLIENYIPENLYSGGGDYIADNGADILIPQGFYALIGDNRPMSNDSRYTEIGLIRRDWIKGKVILRIWPFDTFTFVPQGSYKFE